MRAYAMQINTARKLGQDFFVQGWSEIGIGDWLVDNGYRSDGLTARRIVRGYVDQQNFPRTPMPVI